jgi:hypothetical protein
LIDLCALVGTLGIDPDDTCDPRLVNDRLLLGLEGTISEYELSLLRQRGIAAQDSKALQGELRFILPPGYCRNEIGQIEMDPDKRVGGAIRLLFDKFQELGSAPQLLLWAKDQDLQLCRSSSAITAACARSVQFAGKADRPSVGQDGKIVYANKRDEMWGHARVARHRSDP